MEKRVLIDPFQKVTDEDFLRFGQFPADSIDHVVNDIGIPDRAFTGMQVTGQVGGHLLNVANGRLIDNSGKVYFNDTDGGVEIDIAINLPTVTRRIIAVVTWGDELSAPQEARTFLTDATTRATVARVKSTIELRWAQIDIVVGQEGPDPVRPAIAANVLPVAWIEVDSAGIMSITRELANVAPNVRGLAVRLTADEAAIDLMGVLVNTLRSDLAALAGRINGLAPLDLVGRMAEDVGRLKDHDHLPDTYSDYGGDHFLTPAKSDVLNVQYYARVEEGIRFPWAAIEDDQLGLFNPIDASVVSSGGFILPVYDTRINISNIGRDAELPIANTPVQVFDIIQKSRTRTRTRYGTSFITCTNQAWWASGLFDPASGIFTLTDGETFHIENLGPTFHLGFDWIRATQFWVDTWQEAYTETLPLPLSINGTVVGQSFLNSQEGYITEVGLYVTRKGVAGDLTVMICECTDSGQPNERAVLGQTTVHIGDVNLYPARTVALFDPVLVQTGKRYAFIIVTAGAHFIAQTSGNKFLGGTFFTSTDNGWFQGDNVMDIAFDVGYARFRATRQEVQLNSLQLAGGITDIDILAVTSIPRNTSLTFEFQQNGVWTPMSAATALIGLPPLLPLRAVFSGSQDSMPGLGLLSNSRVRTSRPAATFWHASTAILPGAAAKTVWVDVRLEGWRGAPHHVLGMTLLYGVSFASVQTAAGLTAVVAPDDPNALLVHAIFIFGSAQSTFKIQMEGTTDAVTALFHVADRAHVTFTI